MHARRYQEADDILKAGCHRHPQNGRLARALALNASMAGWIAEAEMRWQRTSELDPTPANLADYSAALRRGGHAAKAEAILAPLVVADDSPANLAVEYGWTAADQGSWPVAVERWQAGLARHPKWRPLRTALASGLHRINRIEAAEQVLEEGMRLQPDVPEYEIELARLATWTDRKELALARWSALHPRHPDREEVAFFLGSTLRNLGRTDEARSILEAASRTFPNNPRIIRELEYIAEPPAEEAAVTWRTVVDLHPNNPMALWRLGAALRRSGRRDEAERLLEAASAKFPKDARLIAEHAGIAGDRQDWDEARLRWEKAVALSPTAPYKLELGYVKLNQIADRESAPREERRAETLAADASPGELLKQFESLGVACEFGLVQRHFGLEPLGLLRFTAIGAPKLIEGLQTRFERLGSPETTRVTMGNEEYLTHDLHYGITSHTFINKHAMGPEDLLRRHSKRIKRVREMFFEDLEQAARICVRLAPASPSEADARRILAALRAYGDNRLLYVQFCPDPKFAGQVTQVDEHLVLAYLDRKEHKVDHWSSSIDTWVAICRKAFPLLSRTAAPA
jgi:tetratricopeptide (TPR) repeat protein